jgi:hypothetical protein
MTEHSLHTASTDSHVLRENIEASSPQTEGTPQAEGAIHRHGRAVVVSSTDMGDDFRRSILLYDYHTHELYNLFLNRARKDLDEKLSAGVIVSDFVMKNDYLESANVLKDKKLPEIKTIPFNVYLDVESDGQIHKLQLFRPGSQPGEQIITLPRSMFRPDYNGRRRVRIRVHIRDENGNIVKTSEIKTNLTNLEMQQMRAQMTPHGFLVFHAGARSLGAVDLSELALRALERQRTSPAKTSAEEEKNVPPAAEAANPHKAIEAKLEKGSSPSLEAMVEAEKRRDPAMEAYNATSVVRRQDRPVQEIRREQEKSSPDISDVHAELQKIRKELQRMNDLARENTRLRALDVIAENGVRIASEFIRVSRMAGQDVNTHRYSELLKEAMNIMARLSYNALSPQAEPLKPERVEKIVEGLYKKLEATEEKIRAKKRAQERGPG